jgi:hypothetical protein
VYRQRRPQRGRLQLHSGVSVVKNRDGGRGRCMPIPSVFPVRVLPNIKQRLLPWSLPNLMRKTVFFFVLFHRRAMQAWILFLVSIERGASCRVYHRPSSLTDMSEFRSAQCRFLARPGCSARRCRRTNVTSLRSRWSVRKTVHGGQGMRLLAVHSRRQVPAIDSDSFLSPLPVPGWVAHCAAGLR